MPTTSVITLKGMAANNIDSDQYVDGSVDLAHMSSQSVDEDNLHISNAGSNGNVLTKQSGNTGGLTWAAAAGGGKMVQVKYADVKTLLTGTTTLPHDDTIPQITEGNEYLTLAITPTTTSNALLIEVQVMISSPGAADLIIAIFNTDVHSTDAQAVSSMYMVTATTTQCMSIQYYYIPGITSATTWRLRCGTHQAGLTNINGGSGNQKFGGKANTSMTITEIEV